MGAESATPTAGAEPVALGRRPALDAQQIDAANVALDGKSPSEIVAWAHGVFGERLVLTSSFSDTVLIDIATREVPEIEVIFVDTGFHFPETLATVRRATERYTLNVAMPRPDEGAVDRWSTSTEACCDARKVAPLSTHLTAHADAWLSGLRRADSPDRADAAIVTVDARGFVKVNPIVAMSDEDYDAYIVANDVIVNPLHDDGYASIGCWPCTQRATDRSGRWAGTGKTECGLNL